MSYKTYRSTKIISASDAHAFASQGMLVLKHDERHLRRKLLHFENGDMLMLDVKQTVQLADGDLLETITGEYFTIKAAIEPLYEVRAKSSLHLLELAWHLGNRHLNVQIFPDYITLLRDKIIAQMLIGLGASIAEIEAPFQPLHGAYHDHSSAHH